MVQEGIIIQNEEKERQDRRLYDMIQKNSVGQLKLMILNQIDDLALK